MADSIDSLYVAITSLWDSASDGLPNLNSLPHQFHEALFAPGGVFDKLTNGGTVPLPVPSSWLESSSSPPSPPPLVTSPPSTRVPQWFNHFLNHLAEHPYIYSTALLSATTGATYYYSPKTLQPLISYLPASILPPPKHRPLRLLPNTHGVAGEVRKECALVLGADSIEGREIALDLEKKGWVVIATVSDPDQVDRLERQGRGWIKVLVLDPSESSSVSPFLRSLSTALSLRFPLHTSGDPYSRPSHALSLTSLIDCLSLSTPSSPIPLEALESDQIRRDLTERISTFVLVSKGILPFLRTSSSRPGAPTSVYLLLLPSIPSSLSLPFSSLSSSLSHSLQSLFHSLRRELSLTPNHSSITLSLLQVGSFEHPSSPSPSPQSKPLPIRLNSLYAPALSRQPPSSSSSLRPKSALKHLTKKVYMMLLRPSHSGVLSLTGAGSLTYYLTHWLGHSMVDMVLRISDSLVSSYVNGRSRIEGMRRSGNARLGGGGTRERETRPLPIPPTHSQRDLPPNPSQVPVKDSFVPYPSSTTTSNRQKEKEEEDEISSSSATTSDEGDDGSSIEDLGVEGEGARDGEESIYGTGSFVTV